MKNLVLEVENHYAPISAERIVDRFEKYEKYSQ